MNIITNELTGHTRDLLVTEVMFFIVSAKSVNADVIKFKIKTADGEAVSEKVLTEITRILKSCKRQRMIQLFLSCDEFEINTTEKEYLLNIYPELPQELGNDYAFVIKL